MYALLIYTPYMEIVELYKKELSFMIFQDRNNASFMLFIVE